MEVLDPKAIHPAVEISVKKGVLQLIGAGPFTTVKERFKVTFEGDTAFVINPNLLRDAIKLSASCVVGERMISIGDDELGFHHVIALQMARQETPEAPAEEETPPPAKTKAPAKKGTKQSTAVDGEDVGW
jgi:hypothetical protein